MVTAGLAESNGSLPPRMTQKVTCGFTACTPGSAPGPTLGNEYGRTLPAGNPTMREHIVSDYLGRETAAKTKTVEVNWR